MNKTQSLVISVGLAIFSMFFGAGNLMYPLKVGMSSGTNTIAGFAGFLVTTVLLPLCGLIAMIYFDGDYFAFFHRLGKIPGNILIALSMIIIGPLIAIPRIVTLSHVMMAPFLPSEFLQHITPLSSLIFSIVFFSITFLATYRENRIVQVLGNIISPLLLLSLGVIIVKGIWTAQIPVTAHTTPLKAFTDNLILGYETLDLLAAIFFSSIVLHILHATGKNYSKQHIAVICLKAGLIGLSLLTLIYMGMCILGLYHGHGLQAVNLGELFRAISFHVLGNHGTAVISTAVFMACLSTAIALSAVVAEYAEIELFNRKISYMVALVLVLLAALPLSIFGLSSVLKLTGGPITYIGYPVIIALTMCNMAYKLIGFKPIKLPVLLVFVLSIISYFSF